MLKKVFQQYIIFVDDIYILLTDKPARISNIYQVSKTAIVLKVSNLSRLIGL